MYQQSNVHIRTFFKPWSFGWRRIYPMSFFNDWMFHGMFDELKDTHREKVLSNKTPGTYKKYEYGHLGRCYIGSTL